MYHRNVFERYLTQSEEKQLLATVAQYQEILARRDHAWMQLLRQTGIRVGTLAGLTVDDAREALRIRRMTVHADNAKGGHGYQVLVNRRAATALRTLLGIRREMGYAPIPDQPLVMSRNHQGISVRSLQDRMRKWVLAAGITTPATPHYFRHTLAKRIIERSTASDPRAIVQHALGHSNIANSAIYTYPDRADLERSMEEAS